MLWFSGIFHNSEYENIIRNEKGDLFMYSYFSLSNSNYITKYILPVQLFSLGAPSGYVGILSAALSRPEFRNSVPQKTRRPTSATSTESYKSSFAITSHKHT